MQKSVTCLIPFYNEGQRLITLVNIVKKAKNIARIICVDDGSTDNIAGILKKKYPQVLVVKSPKNQGKAHAVKLGLKFVRTDYILLLDGDINFLKTGEIDEAVRKTLDYSMDLVILRRINSSFLVKLNRGEHIFSGERILKTQDLNKIVQSATKNYMLDIAINAYMIKHQKKVGWVPSSALNPYKVTKWGLATGLIKSLQMNYDFIKFKGPLHYLLQISNFCKNKLLV